MNISSETETSIHRLSESARARVRHAQVDLLWRNAPIGYAANALIALILTFALAGSLAPAIYWWAAGVMLITLVRAVLSALYRSTPRKQLDARRWGALFIATSAAMGVAWGVLGGVLFAQADEPGKALIAITIAGSVAGAVVNNGFIPTAYYVYLAPALLPLIARALQSDGHFGQSLALLATLFGLFMLLSVRRAHQSLVGNLISIHQLEEMTRELNRAQHDALTGLPTRSLLYDRLEQAVLHAERHRKLLAVLFIDLDGFKQLNDTLGHDAGDQVLTRLARRLKESVRAEDTVARHGGDEFVLVLSDLTKIADAEAIARKLLAQVAALQIGEDRARMLTASIGVAFHPYDGASGAQLISAADAAMYRAKQRGKNTYELSPEALAAGREKFPSRNENARAANQ
jgi:diguanylate cyclase (GGDEF)-like protein